MTDAIARAEQRLHWTRHVLDAPALELQPASADASFRSYWRGRSADGRSLIVMDAPPGHEDIRPWLDVDARLCRAGLAAPQVLASDPLLGFIAMQDLGNRTYLPELNPASVDILYADALDALLTMQRDVDAQGLPRYDEPHLVAELELLPRWFLERHLGLHPDCGTWDVLEVAFRQLVNAALAQPVAFVHRDFHSRNLLVLDDGGPGIIDFQDAVLGPQTYDLVSLLRDCYIVWPAARVERWALNYRLRLIDAGLLATDAGPQAFLRSFDLMGLQRHLKVLGIFCRLCYRDGKRGYLADLPRVHAYAVAVARRYPELAALAALLERAAGGRDLTEPAP